MTDTTTWEHRGVQAVLAFDFRGSGRLGERRNGDFRAIYEELLSVVAERLGPLSIDSAYEIDLHGDGGIIVSSPDGLLTLVEVAFRLAQPVPESLGQSHGHGFVVAVSQGIVSKGVTLINGISHRVFAGSPVQESTSVTKAIRPGEVAVHRSAGADGQVLPQFVGRRLGSEFLIYTPATPGADALLPGPKESLGRLDDRYSYRVELQPSDGALVEQLADDLSEMRHLLRASPIDIEPIGSIGLDGLWTKPITDVMVRVDEARLASAMERLAESGLLRVELQELPSRVMFRRRGADGAPELHVHLVNPIEWVNSRERRFRRTLEENTQLREAYSAAKRLLQAVSHGDPEEYGSLKSQFIKWAERLLGLSPNHGDGGEQP